MFGDTDVALVQGHSAVGEIALHLDQEVVRALLAAPISNGEMCTLSRQSTRDRLTDPPRSAGDQSDPAQNAVFVGLVLGSSLLSCCYVFSIHRALHPWAIPRIGCPA